MNALVQIFFVVLVGGDDGLEYSCELIFRQFIRKNRNTSISINLIGDKFLFGLSLRFIFNLKFWFEAFLFELWIGFGFRRWTFLL